MAAGREARPLSGCFSLRYKNRCALRNGPRMAGFKYLRVPVCGSRPRYTRTSQMLAPQTMIHPGLRTIVHLRPATGHKTGTPGTIEGRFNKDLQGVSLIGDSVTTAVSGVPGIGGDKLTCQCP